MVPIFLSIIVFMLICAVPARAVPLGDLPPLPNTRGFGGAFAGVSNDAFLVAGGTNFPEAGRGEGEKTWHDGVFVLEPGGRQWRTGYKLPRRLAYGVSVTTDFGLICVGGSDEDRAYASVWLLEWTGGAIRTTRLPDLPEARAAAAGAPLDGAVYIAGGQTCPDGQHVTRTFWRLELPKKTGGSVSWDGLRWEALESWPGPARARAVAVAQAGGFYLMSGFDLAPGEVGTPRRRYLNDGYRYDPHSRAWRRVADAPRPVAAAPAAPCGESHILVFGGHDGLEDHPIAERKKRRPGFRRDLLAYHTITDTWAPMGSVPVGLASTNAVAWQGKIVVPGGEVRPGAYSNQVYHVQPQPAQRAFGVINTVVLCLYLLALVAMGAYFSRREKSTDDFFVGGRRVPWWAAGLSIFGTQLSSIAFMAIPAKVYDTDWTYFLGVICIALIQPVIIYFYLPFFRRLNVTSAYEYLEKRFNLAVRLFGSASFILFQAGRMTIVLFLPALALSAVTGFDIRISIIAMGLLATVYTAMGGMEAVVWTDVLQVIVLIGGGLDPTLNTDQTFPMFIAQQLPVGVVADGFPRAGGHRRGAVDGRQPGPGPLAVGYVHGNAGPGDGQLGHPCPHKEPRRVDHLYATAI